MKAAIINIFKNGICSCSDAGSFVESQLIRRGVDVVSSLGINHSACSDLSRQKSCCSKNAFSLALAAARQQTNFVFVLCGEEVSLVVKKQICEAFEDKLAENKFASNFVTGLLAKTGRKLEKQDKLNITIGERARCILNKQSSYCGFLYESEGKYLFFLTNNLTELEPMFNDGAVPILENRLKNTTYSIVFKTFGLNEEEVVALTMPADPATNDFIEIKVIEKFPECEVHLVYNSKTPKVLLDDYTAFVMTSLNEFVCASGAQTLSQIAIDILETKKQTISILEGATLGALTSNILKENTNGQYYVSHSTLFLKDFATCNNEKELGNAIYNEALNVLKTNHTDYCLCTFKSIPGTDPNIFYVVVGDKENIHIFKEVYKQGCVTPFEDYVAKTALFYLVKKLKYGT